MARVLRAANATADGTLVAGEARIKTIVIRSAATAGTVVLRDGGAGGSIKCTIPTPAVVGLFPIQVPAPGLLFTTDVYVDFTTADGIIIFYE